MLNPAPLLFLALVAAPQSYFFLVPRLPPGNEDNAVQCVQSSVTNFWLFRR
jgi:hypothetical protein